MIMNFRFSTIVFLCLLNGATRLLAQIPVDSLALADSLLLVEVDREIAGLSARAGLLDSLFLEKSDAATLAREQADATLETAKQDTTLDAEALKSIKNDAKQAKNDEKKASDQRKQAARTLALARKTEALPPTGRRQNLPKLRASVQELAIRAGLESPPAEPPIAAVIGVPGVSDAAPPPDTLDNQQSAISNQQSSATPPKPKTRSVPAAQRYRRYNPDDDVTLHPPALPCILAQNTRDEFSGETYRELKRGELFRFTNEYVKKIMPQGQPHVVCEAALAEKGAAPSLWLTFTIHDPNARKTFGGLARNGIAVLKFMDGQTVTVYNLRPDEGVSDPAGQVFIFRAQYALDRGILRKIQSAELDKIRVAWSTGYEDYDVQNVNLLRRQAGCL